MSREVIGTGTTVEEHDHVPAPRDGAPTSHLTRLDDPAASEVDTPTATTDDDAPSDPATPSRRLRAWPDAAPAWLAAPVGVMAAVLVGLLVGALLGTGVAERSASQERAESVRLVGGLAYPENGFSTDVRGGGDMRIDVLVINAGPETVRVVGAALPESSSSSLALAEPFEVEPGETVRGKAELRLDCDDPGVGDVVTTVQTPDGRSRDVDLRATDDAALGRGELGYLCGDFGPMSTIDVFPAVSSGEGSLSMTVRNTSDRPVELTFDGPAGTTIVGDPAFPLALDPDASAFLELSVQVDQCTGAATRPDAGNDLQLLVNGERDVALLDPVVTSGWLSRQVALVCP